MKFTADDLQFQDDEEAEFGSDGDFGMSYDSGNDRMELVDKINSAVSHIPRGRSGSLVKGRFGRTLAEGKVLADDGNVYESVQSAVDAGSSWVKIGPGNFSLRNRINIQTNGLTLKGSGKNTVLRNAVEVLRIDASDVKIADMHLRSNINPNFQGDLATTGSSANRVTYENISTKGAGHNIRLKGGKGHKVVNCRIIESELAGILIDGSERDGNTVFANNIVEKTVKNDGIYSNGVDNVIFANNRVQESGRNGVNTSGDDCVLIGNTVRNASLRGIVIRGNDNIIANNRISKADDSIFIDGSGNIEDSNLKTQ